MPRDSLMALLVLGLLTKAALAQDTNIIEGPIDEQEAAAIGRGSTFLVGGGVLWQAPATFSGGGDLSILRGYGAVDVSTPVDRGMAVSAGIEWDGNWYDFGQGTPLGNAIGGADPWDTIVNASTNVGTTIRVDSRWTVLLQGFVSTNGEHGADFSDTITGGGFGAFSYRMGPDFNLGLGVIGSSRIEDDPLIVPVILIDWELEQGIRLTNVDAPQAFPTGPGIELVFDVSKECHLAFGGRWSYQRFRLDDDGPAARSDGVGEDQSIPLWVRSGWRHGAARMDVVFGFNAMQELTISDSSGDRLASADMNPAILLGAFFSVDF
ncbi:MAG: hypothetical protein FJ252_07265 [Phycisphaerae bacterium]|nr:hypothetical protein [Phycisphaerae bacterium]